MNTSDDDSDSPLVDDLSEDAGIAYRSGPPDPDKSSQEEAPDDDDPGEG